MKGWALGCMEGLYGGVVWKGERGKRGTGGKVVAMLGFLWMSDKGGMTDLHGVVWGI